jgi:hypothetical protein
VFVTANFAHKENRIQNQTRNNYSEKDDAENEQRDFAQIEQNPTDVERDRQRDQTDAENEEKNCGSSPPHFLMLNGKRKMENAG